MPVIDFVLQRLEARHDLRTAPGKAAAAAEIAEVLAGIASPIEQDHYIREVAARLRVEPDAVRRLLRNNKHQRGTVPHESPDAPSPPAAVVARGEALDDYLLALLIRAREIPEAAAAVTPDPEFILTESAAVYRALGGHIEPGLEPYVSRAERYLPDAKRLTLDQLLREIDQKQLDIKNVLLDRQAERIRARLREIAANPDDAEPAEMRQYADDLSAVARAKSEIDDQSPPGREREKAGAR